LLKKLKKIGSSQLNSLLIIISKPAHFIFKIVFDIK
jgi:hypothetical protein